LIIVGASALIALIIGWFSVGVANIVHIPGIDFLNVANAGNTPIWFASLLVFLAFGIPFFFLFYLGLKIIINNLKSIGSIAKFTLLGLWLFAIIGLSVIAIREASEHAFNESYIEKTDLNVTKIDTLNIKMIGNDNFRDDFYRNNNFKLAYNEKGKKVIYASDIRIIVKPTTDSVATLAIEKSADGRDYEKARERAKNIIYNFELKNNTLVLDSYFTTNPENKFSDQELKITLYLPVGCVVNFNHNTKDFLNYDTYDGNIVASKHANHYIKIAEDSVLCDDCTEDEFEVNIDTPNVNIDENGIEIKSEGNNLKIDENGIKAESKKVKVNIDANGINIKSDN